MVFILVLHIQLYTSGRNTMLFSTDRSVQVQEMIESTRKAWNLVKGRIYTHGIIACA